MQDHIKSIHFNKRDFKCQLCEYSANISRSLKDHVRIVHINNKKYSCDSCPYLAYTNQALQDHIMSKHSKDKNFVCMECDKKFASRPTLVGHVKRLNFKIKLKSRQCNICEVKLSTNRHLNKHMKAKHGEVDLNK